METTEEKNHARDNALAWLESIADMLERYGVDEDKTNEEGDVIETADEIREKAQTEIEESPLSVQVRGGWGDPGSDDLGDPVEFEILLSTGGPALRIRGDLDEYKQPSRAYLQFQDWGTPWTDFFGTEQDRKNLLEFAQVFYYGE